MTTLLNMLLLFFLIVCAVCVARTRDLLSAIVIFAAYSLIMAVIWQQLEAPDIAITEAAIGAGVTTLLLIATISKTRREE
ncbi:MAG: cation:proton antiporter [Firmicutes bacterium HGW-Firmicutes-13]|nr:MAG: cation:proton antiporter [Firmicutes bacterium HGW-Firmicutes-13]